MKRIFIDRDACQGCLGCALACMAEHNAGGKSIYDLDLGDRANETKNNIMKGPTGQPTPVFCRHCDDPECVRACMSGAMTKNLETGRVDYDQDRCASCYMCVMSCRFGVLKVDALSQKIIQKCDACGGDRAGGPRCAEECPTGALEVKEAN